MTTGTRATGGTGDFLYKGKWISAAEACAIRKVKPKALRKNMLVHGSIDPDEWAPRLRGGKPSSPTAYAETLQALFDVVLDEPEKPMTVRRAYYRAGPTGAKVPGIGKTEDDYRKVSRMLTDMRRGFSKGGETVEPKMPHKWIVDNTRSVDKVSTWSSVRDFMDTVSHVFKGDVWKDREAYVEVWAEKDVGFTALTHKYRVPLIVTHGQISEGFLEESAERLSAIDDDKDIYVFHIGDHDPSGDNIVETIENGLIRLADTEYNTDLEDRLHYDKLALTEYQVRDPDWNITTRPTKGTGGKFADDWEAEHGEGSAELDAIAPSQLVALIEAAINEHLPEDELDDFLVGEAKQRARIAAKIKRMKW